MLANSAADAGVPLVSVIDRIEIFNEADLRNKMTVVAQEDPEEPDPTITKENITAAAEMYAEAYVAIVQGYKRGFIKAGVNAPRFFLPSLSSYVDEAEGRSWVHALLFLEALLDAIDAVLAAPPYSETGLTFDDVVDGIDYHWYHFDVGGQRHIAYLFTEVEVIEDLLHAHSASGKTVVTVGEIGSSAGEYVSPISNPTEVFNPTSLSYTEFQACEVWRRLGGALASNAESAGWHAWMAGNEGQFWMSGVRRDDHGSDASPETSKQRDSWGRVPDPHRPPVGREERSNVVAPDHQPH